MDNKNQNMGVIFPDESGGQPSASSGLSQTPLSNSEALSSEPEPYQPNNQPLPVPEKKANILIRLVKRADVVLALLLLLGGVGLFLRANLTSQESGGETASSRFDTTQIPLEEIINEQGIDFGNQSVTINGPFQLNSSFVVAPSARPANAVAGQIYFDQTTNELAYFNGTQFIPVGGVSSIQGAGGITITNDGAGNITVNGPGAPAPAPTPTITGVTSLNGLSGGLTVANASTAGTTITIDDASTTTKGIASFNGANFTVAGGAVNTIQDINTSATPTFAGVNTNLIQGSSSLTLLSGGNVILGSPDPAATLLVVDTKNSAGDPTGVDGAIYYNSVTGHFRCFQGGAWTNCVTAAGGAVTLQDSYDSSTPAVINLNGTNDGIIIRDAGPTIGGNLFAVQSNDASTTYLGVTTNGVNVANTLTVGVANSQTGTLQLADSGSAFMGALRITTLGQNTTYTLPDPGQAAASICLTTGNCAGTGAGVTSITGGTVNRLAKFTASQNIENSTITDDGTNVTTSVDLIIQGGDLTVGVPTTQTGTINLAHSGSAFQGSLVQGVLTANRTYLLPDADGTVCLSSGNCSGTGSSNTLQAAYDAGNTITTTDARNISITLADTATDASFLINLECDTGCGNNGRFAIQEDATDVFVISASSGVATFRNSANNAQAFNVEESAGGNLFTVDTINSRVGINLGGNNTPTLAVGTGGLEVSGAIRLSGSGMDTYTTPLGTGISTRLSVVNANLAAFTQIMALGVTAASDPNARAITVTDARAGSHQPTIGVFSPNESQVSGLSWDGSNTGFRIKNSNTAGTVALTLGTTDKLIATAAGGTVNGLLTIATLGTANTSTALCLNGANEVAACNTQGAGVAFINGGNSFNGPATLGTNDAFDLSIERGGATQLTVGNGNVTLATNVDLILQGATAYISNPQGSTGSEAFGLNASVGADQSVAIGNGASTLCNNSVAIGYNATFINCGTGGVAIGHNVSTNPNSVAIGNSAGAGANGIAIGSSAGASGTSVAIGRSATSSTQSVAIGDSATTSGLAAVALGHNAAANGNGSIAIGLGATSASRQLVIGGSTASDGYIQDAYLGSGVTDVTPVDFTLHGTSGAGTDVAGADLNIAAGQGTGSAVGGSINLQVSAAGTSGTSLNALSTVATFESTGITIGNATLNTQIALTSGSGGITLGGITTIPSVGVADTATFLCRNSSNQIATCSTTGSGAAYVQGGNSFGATAILGTNDAFGLDIEVNSTTVATISTIGAVVFQNNTNSVNAFRILNQAGDSTILNADTVNGRIGIGGTAGLSKFEVIDGDAAVYNDGLNPRLILGDSTTAGQHGFLQWDSTNDYFRIETAGTNGLKIKDNFVSIGNLFPDQPLKVGSGATLLAQVNTTGQAMFQNSSDSATAFTVLNAAGVSQFTVDSTDSRVYIGNPVADATGALLVLDTKNTAGDPTGVNGAIYYNSSADKMRCYEAGFWRDCIYSARTTFLVASDLTATGGDSNFVFGQALGGGVNGNAVGSVAGHPGIVRLNTNTDPSGRASIMAENENGVLLGNNDTYRFEVVISIPILSNVTDRYTVRAGFSDNNDGEATDGCYFRYTDTTLSGRWEGVCRDNNVESTCDTGIAASANTWIRLNVVVNSAGTSADFQTDGTSRCQIATNIPTGAGRGTGFGIMQKKFAGTNSRTVEVDYIEVLGLLSTPR